MTPKAKRELARGRRVDVLATSFQKALCSRKSKSQSQMALELLACTDEIHSIEYSVHLMHFLGGNGLQSHHLWSGYAFL